MEIHVSFVNQFGGELMSFEVTSFDFKVGDKLTLEQINEYQDLWDIPYLSREVTIEKIDHTLQTTYTKGGKVYSIHFIVVTVL